MAAEKTRYGWLDVMKLIGIYFVWAAHREGMGRYGLFFLSIVLGVLFFASGFSAGRRAQTPMPAFIREKFFVQPFDAGGARPAGANDAGRNH